MADKRSVTMYDVRIIFRNFAGKEGKYNREGDRNFGVIVPDDIAETMLHDGWNIKYLEPREEDEDETRVAWLPVSASFDKGRPPRVVLITSRGRTNLTVDTVEQLDWVDITNVDLIVNPYEYTVQGNSGIKAYLQSMYVTIEEDELEQKYATMDAQ